jgi:signal transduction histidine kinase
MKTETTASKANILIVDDLPENLLALDALIRQEGRAIHQALCGEAALALLLQHEFALAVLDVQMPGMNGFELAEIMRSTERTRHIPIVFVSAAGQELNYAFKGYETGAVDFLHKPLDTHAVRSKVNVFVDLYLQRRAVKEQFEALEQAHRTQQDTLEQLRTAQTELQRAVRMRDDFLSVVSNELRSPLNALFLETQARKIELDKAASGEVDVSALRNCADRDQRQIESMVKVIDDMLDMARLRRGRLTIRPRPMELVQLVQRVAQTLPARLDMADTKVALQGPEAVFGTWDAFRIEQVVVNLLTNALRYGQGRPVAITVSADSHTARVDVRDQGIGIAPQDQQRIFGQFERAVDDQVATGLGLGLFITREIVDSHGGTITLRSTPGQGSVFSVQLPRETRLADDGPQVRA